MQIRYRSKHCAGLRVVIGFLLWLMLTGMAQATPPNSEEWGWDDWGADQWAEVRWGPTVTSFTWYPFIAGDFDLNGEVNIADITVLGQQFGKVAGGASFTPYSAEWIVDVDMNGEINISDLSTIGLQFGTDCTGGFNVYRDGETPELLAHLGFVDSHHTEHGMLGCSYDLGDTPGGTFLVKPIDALGVEGAEGAVISRSVPGDEVNTITFPTYNSTTGILSWYYDNNGDYNQDGLVWLDPWADDETNSDVIPLGAHFGTSYIDDWSSIKGVVDGDHNGEINISDITRIGLNSGNIVQGYHVYTSDIVPEDYPIDMELLGSVLFTDAQGDRATDRLWFTFDLGTPPPARYLWVAPYFEDQIGGRSFVWDSVEETWTEELPDWVHF